MKKARYRVFARFDGEVSFVNAFFDPVEARRLTQTPRKRYCRHGAAF